MTIRSGSPARASRPLCRALLIVAGVVTCGCATHRQAGPPQPASNSEVFLAPFHEGDKTTYRFALLVVQGQGVKVGKPVNITKHPGNDRHPAFLADSSGLAFSSATKSNHSLCRADRCARSITPMRSWVPVPCLPPLNP